MKPAWFPILPATVLGALATLLTQRVVAEDWPMWRFDAQRSAASQNQLPDDFQLLWRNKFSPREQAWDDPLNHDLMTYDRLFEPIIVDGQMLLSFNDRDKVCSFDTATGKERWSVFADAPIRLPLVGWQDRIYFCSDDGFLYCVDAADGSLHWKFDAAPNRQQAIGNQRLSSAWPARGGPVVRDGTVYFAASIWPFMGTFIYALDAETGEVEWVNDSTGAQYIKQPHSAPSFAGVAPQGALVATKDLLLVPGGRSVPAAFDRSDGTLRYFEINAGGKGTGGSFVSADDQHFYVHTRRKGTRAFKLGNGVKTAFTPTEPVLLDGFVYSADVVDQEARIRAYGKDQQQKWEVSADGTRDLIAVKGHLVAAGPEQISIVRLPIGEEKATVIRTIATDQPVERLVVADLKLFAVTANGEVLAFGDPDQSIDRKSASLAANTTQLTASKSSRPKSTESKVQSSDNRASRVLIDRLLASEEIDREGYAFWFGGCETDAVSALIDQSTFRQLAVMDKDADAVRRRRRELDSKGRYGAVTLHVGEPGDAMLPHYVSHLMVLDQDSLGPFAPETIATLYKSVRPYGGVMHILCREDREKTARQIVALQLEQAEVVTTEDGVTVTRVGALPGSADWTHQYGDVANSIKSDDRRVQLPLGILWFGGSSNLDVLPRHGHGPPEQVIGGRLFIQGMNSLSARDVYTGRVLWKREFKDLGTFDVYYDNTYEDTPLDPKYNQVHIPGANGRGTNYVVTEDRVYIVEGDTCHVLDPKTGKTLTDVVLPKVDGQESNWGYIGIYGDVLLGGMGFAKYRERFDLSFESDVGLKPTKAGFGSKSYDRAASVALVGFDRHTGEVLWKQEANHSFWHNGIVAGGDQVYCLDKNPAPIEEAMRRRGRVDPDTYRIVAFDYRTGEKQWEVSEGIFGTWLGYSERHDVLLQAGAAASDRLKSEVGQGMSVHSAQDGSIVWKKESLKYTGPCILHNDLIITNTNSYAESAGAFFIEDGRQKMVANPITGQLQPWKLTRAYGCNNIIASENLLTFRSGAAGYYDLRSNAGTGNLGGFKSGCTSNLVVANGVLNAPDYTRTCSCAYQNQTSLALVHMPTVEMWSVNSAASVKAHGQQIEQVGINFGAAGDRRDPNGTLWLEYPIAAGPSPPISIEMNDVVTPYRNHSTTSQSSKLPWVTSSGVDGLTELTVAVRLRDEYELHTGIPVQHVDDDAEESETGAVDLSSSDLEFVQDSGTQLVGLRFNNIKIKPDAKIRDAYIQFTCDEPAVTPTSLIIAAEDTGDAKRFTSEMHDLSSRSLTQTEIGWDPEMWPLKNASAKVHRTPNLTPILESLITRDDWKSGNSIAFIVSGTGKRIASAYSKANEKQARLVVDLEQSPDLEAVAEENYQVRLHFGAPANSDGQTRIFDVFVDDRLAIENVTIEPGQTEGLVHTLSNVPVRGKLRLRFKPKQGTPLLSGLEMIRQRDDGLE